MDGIQFMTTVERECKTPERVALLDPHARRERAVVKISRKSCRLRFVHFSFLEALGMKTVRLHSAQNRLNSLNYTKFSPPDVECGVCLKTNEL